MIHAKGDEVKLSPFMDLKYDKKNSYEAIYIQV